MPKKSQFSSFAGVDGAPQQASPRRKQHQCVESADTGKVDTRLSLRTPPIEENKSTKYNTSKEGNDAGGLRCRHRQQGWRCIFNLVSGILATTANGATRKATTLADTTPC
jgi:hypothetical protein